MKGQQIITVMASLACAFILVSSNYVDDQFCPDTICPDNNTGLFPSPATECGYCFCFDSTAQYMPCPDGTGFQPPDKCVPDDNCTSSSTTEEPGTSGTAEETTAYFSTMPESTTEEYTSETEEETTAYFSTMPESTPEESTWVTDTSVPKRGDKNHHRH